MNTIKKCTWILLLTTTLSASESFANWRNAAKENLKRLSHHFPVTFQPETNNLNRFEKRIDWVADTELRRRAAHRQVLAELGVHGNDLALDRLFRWMDPPSDIFLEENSGPDMSGLGFNFPNGINSTTATFLLTLLSKKTPTELNSSGATENSAAPVKPIESLGMSSPEGEKDSHLPCSRDNHHAQLLKKTHHAHEHLLEIHKKIGGKHPHPIVFLATQLPKFAPPPALVKELHTFFEHSKHHPLFKNHGTYNPNDPVLQRRIKLWNTSTDEALDLHTSYETTNMIKDIGKRLYFAPEKESKKLLQDLKTWATEKDWGKNRDLGKELLKNISEAAQHSGGRTKSAIACLQIAGIFVANFGVKIGLAAKHANGILTTEKEVQKMTARAADNEKLLPQHKTGAVENTAAGYAVLNAPKAIKKGDAMKLLKVEKSTRKLYGEEQEPLKERDMNSRH